MYLDLKLVLLFYTQFPSIMSVVNAKLPHTVSYIV